MSKVELLEPILEDGIRNTNFFNGRLLTAEDLRAEQDANREQHWQLGRAVGEGVAYGLEVSRTTTGSPPSAPSVTIKAGLSINRKGQALLLAEDTEVVLVHEKQSSTDGAGLFSQCGGSQTTATLAGAGLYVLVITPASGFSGRAQASGLGQTSLANGSCGSRYAVAGVMFRMVALNLSNLPGVSQSLRDQISPLLTATDATSRAKLRNLLAYICFGIDEMKQFYAEPFRLENNETPYAEYGAIDALRRTGSLTDCDVPLALVHLTGAGIQLIDRWSARRRIVRCITDERLPMISSDRRAGEAEAMRAHFQDEIAAIKTEVAGVANFEADDGFIYLPAGGYLPTGAGGFDWRKFLGPMAPPAETYLEESMLPSIVRQSLLEEPVTVVSFSAAAQPGLSPPVPMSVYRAPSQNNFIVFARSTGARIRLFLTPTSPNVQDVTAQATRGNMESRGVRVAAGRWVIDELAPGTYRINITSNDFEPVTPFEISIAGGRTTDLAITLRRIQTTPAEPARCVNTEVLGREVRICMLRDSLNPIRNIGSNFRELDPLPRKVEDWLITWQDWFRKEFPDLRIADNATPAILIEQEKLGGFVLGGIVGGVQGTPRVFARFDRAIAELSITRS